MSRCRSSNIGTTIKGYKVRWLLLNNRPGQFGNVTIFTFLPIGWLYCVLAHEIAAKLRPMSRTTFYAVFRMCILHTCACWMHLSRWVCTKCIALLLMVVAVVVLLPLYFFQLFLIAWPYLFFDASRKSSGKCIFIQIRSAHVCKCNNNTCWCNCTHHLLAPGAHKPRCIDFIKCSLCTYASHGLLVFVSVRRHQREWGRNRRRGILLLWFIFVKQLLFNRFQHSESNKKLCTQWVLLTWWNWKSRSIWWHCALSELPLILL